MPTEESIKQLEARRKNYEILRLTNMLKQIKVTESVNLSDKKYKEHAAYYVEQMIFQRKRKCPITNQ